MARSIEELLGLVGSTKKEDDEQQLLQAIDNQAAPGMPTQDAAQKLQILEKIAQPTPIKPKISNLSPMTSDESIAKEVLNKKSEMSMEDFNKLKDLGQPKPIESDINDELKQAQKANLIAQIAGGLADVSSQFGSAFTKGRVKPLVLGDTARALGQQAVTNVKEKQALAKDQQAKQLADLQLKQTQDRMDPNSDSSKSMRKAIESFKPELVKMYGDSWNKITMADAPLLLDPIKLKESLDARKETAKSFAEDRAIKREENRLKEETLRQERDIKKLDKDVTDLSKRYSSSGIPEAYTTLQALEKELEGIKDIPGYGRLGGLTPDFLTSEKGSRIRQLVNTLANVKLKQRSGAAVTDPEFSRFQKEFGTGTFKSEQALLDGLANYKRNLNSLIKEHASGAPEAAVSEYRSREGAILPFEEPSSKVKVRLSDGRVGFIGEKESKELLKKDPGAKVLK